MYQFVIYNLVKSIGRKVYLPVVIVLGFIGYEIESLLSDKYTPPLESVQEKRLKRMLEEEEGKTSSLKESSFVPKTIFEKNLSPSLLKDDPRLARR